MKLVEESRVICSCLARDAETYRYAFTASQLLETSREIETAQLQLRHCNNQLIKFPSIELVEHLRKQENQQYIITITRCIDCTSILLKMGHLKRLPYDTIAKYVKVQNKRDQY